MQKLRFIPLFLPLFLPLFVQAQTATEGIVYYDETVKLQLDVREDNPALQAQLPTSQTVKWTLAFNESASLWRGDDSTPAENTHEAASDGASVRMVMVRPDNRTYKNFDESRKVDSRDFMGRRFLIRDALRQPAWKLGDQQKTVLGFNCRNATLVDGDRTIEAWFAPELAVPAGPADLDQLPGLILEANINQGDRVIKATRIDRKPLGKDDLEVPTKGKEVTEAEYNKIRDEKLKEMNAEGGGGQMRVIIRN